jgi:hypothetical protein
MVELSLKFTLSEKAFDFLKYLSENNACYRDPRYDTIEDFLVSDDHLVSGKTVSWFNDRNCNGTRYLITELVLNRLIMLTDDYHETWEISQIGSEVLRQNTPQVLN